jgi:hypothetical protein
MEKSARNQQTRAAQARRSSAHWGPLCGVVVLCLDRHDFEWIPCFSIKLKVEPSLSVCVFITVGPIIKLCAGEGGYSEGHVL